MKKLIFALFVATIISSGCRTLSETGESHVSNLEPRPTTVSASAKAYDLDGTQFICTDQDPVAICPQIAVSPSPQLVNQCDQAGGDIRACGPCAQDFGCTVDFAASSRVYQSDGTQFICTNRDSIAICPQIAISPSPQDVARCDQAGGETRACGPCGQEFGCTVDFTASLNVYRPDGTQFICANQDPMAICPQIAVSPSPHDVAQCDRVGGEIRACGPCAQEFGCTARP